MKPAQMVAELYGLDRQQAVLGLQIENRGPQVVLNDSHAGVAEPFLSSDLEAPLLLHLLPYRLIGDVEPRNF